MATRQRVNGHKFQADFWSAFLKIEENKGRIRRIHTPNSGTTEPADFIIFKNYMSYAETKETTKDRIGMANLEQLAEIKWFESIKRPFMKYYLIVHFITYKMLKVIEGKDVLELLEAKKQLTKDLDIGKTFNSLEELVTKGELF